MAGSPDGLLALQGDGTLAAGPVGAGWRVAILNRNEPTFCCVPASACAALLERLEQPHVPAARLHRQKNRLKIKLRDAGQRLVHEVRDEIVTVLIVATGKREREAVCKAAAKR